MGNLFFVIEVDESLDDGSLDDDSWVIFDLVSLGDIVVVLTNGSTGDDSAEIPNMHQNLIKHLSSNIVEVDVNTLRAVLS